MRTFEIKVEKDNIFMNVYVMFSGLPSLAFGS